LDLSGNPGPRHDLSFPSYPDEKNGIPNSPQKIVLTLNLDAEKEPEPELDEPQKPEKPSIFVVFWKVRLDNCPQPLSLGKMGGTTLSRPH
jgi:hypothetical protein